MNTTLFVIWIILGLIATWRTYYGTMKDWYEVLGTDIRKTDNLAVKSLMMFTVFFIAGGLMSLIILEYSFKNVWYYKIPK